MEKSLGTEEAARMADLQDLTCYGRSLIEKNNVSVTSYGYLTCADGGPLFATAEQAPEPEIEQQTAPEMTMGM